jgi:prephenate dehydrogenase
MQRQGLGIIGVGAFGQFMAGYLAPYFDLVLCDSNQDVSGIAKTLNARVGSLAEATACAIVVLAVPVQKLKETLGEIAPLLKAGTLVLDVGSVKVNPTQLMREMLPEHVDVVGTHPLFGPQSGKNGIAGFNVAVCNIRGDRAACVEAFLADKLKLTVHATTPEAHDKELAYVQGLTHLLAKVVVAMDLPEFAFTTRTYDYMQQMVEMVRYDSDELFKAIERENPFSAEAKKSFFTAARQLEEKLKQD